MTLKSQNGKTKIGDSEYQNRHIRRFLRVLSAGVMLFYFGYFMYSKVTTGDPNLNHVDGLIVFFAFAVLVTVESVRVYAKRKLEKLK